MEKDTGIHSLESLLCTVHLPTVTKFIGINSFGCVGDILVAIEHRLHLEIINMRAFYFASDGKKEKNQIRFNRELEITKERIPFESINFLMIYYLSSQPNVEVIQSFKNPNELDYLILAPCFEEQIKLEGCSQAYFKLLQQTAFEINLRVTELEFESLYGLCHLISNLECLPENTMNFLKSY